MRHRQHRELCEAAGTRSAMSCACCNSTPTSRRTIRLQGLGAPPGRRPLPFSAIEVPPPPVPGATVMIEAWAYARDGEPAAPRAARRLADCAASGCIEMDIRAKIAVLSDERTPMAKARRNGARPPLKRPCGRPVHRLSGARRSSMWQGSGCGAARGSDLTAAMPKRSAVP
jgi:hypothetical protein